MILELFWFSFLTLKWCIFSSHQKDPCPDLYYYFPPEYLTLQLQGGGGDQPSPAFNIPPICVKPVIVLTVSMVQVVRLGEGPVKVDESLNRAAGQTHYYVWVANGCSVETGSIPSAGIFKESINCDWFFQQKKQCKKNILWPPIMEACAKF